MSLSGQAYSCIYVVNPDRCYNTIINIKNEVIILLAITK